MDTFRHSRAVRRAPDVPAPRPGHESAEPRDVRGTGSAGFCRVTVVAPDRRTDLALPDDLPVADLRADILRLSGQAQDAAEPVGYHLVRRDGTALDPALSLSAQHVLDGEFILLRTLAASLPPPVHDDVADAVSTAVSSDRRRWTDGMTRSAGLTGGAVLMAAFCWALWQTDPVRHDMHGLPGVVAAVTGTALAALAAVRARVYGDRSAAVALGLAALPHLLLAGSGVLAPAAGQGAGRLQFLAGCATVLPASAALAAVLPAGDAPFVASAVLAAAGTLAAYGTVTADAPLRDAAAVVAVAAVGLIGFLPGWSARAARLPIGFGCPAYPAALGTGAEFHGDQAGDTEPALDYAVVAARARRGHELLLGLVGGCAASLVGAAAVLGCSHSVSAQVLALASGLAALLRARLFRRTAQVGALLAAGVLALALPVVGPAPPVGVPGLRGWWPTGAVAAAAGVLVAIGLTVPGRGVSPFRGRCLEIAEGAVLLSLVPLCLAVLGTYGAVRGLGGG
ncbi:type VII secretion integral membrane protein EccD [Streptomyces sp. NPDC020983]|uniref:type VII secretion integral membrane protein EccD n=1 Tax=Streptomyces sp. NPDC020983 TaxID=3365106 RepID=UPI0037960118